MVRLLLVVTGASRGFGKAVCEAFVDAQGRSATGDGKLPSDNDDTEDAITEACCKDEMGTIVRCCLVARSSQGLLATKESLQNRIKADDSSCVITTHEVDLGDLDTLDSKLIDILQSVPPNEYDKLILINNAGSIGEIGPMTTQAASLTEWRRTIDLNVTSMFWSTRVWGQWAVRNNLEAVLVNVSSLVAIQPFPTMALYSAGKAVR